MKNITFIFTYLILVLCFVGCSKEEPTTGIDLIQTDSDFASIDTREARKCYRLVVTWLEDGTAIFRCSGPGNNCCTDDSSITDERRDYVINLSDTELENGLFLNTNEAQNLFPLFAEEANILGLANGQLKIVWQDDVLALISINDLTPVSAYIIGKR